MLLASLTSRPPPYRRPEVSGGPAGRRAELGSPAEYQGLLQPASQQPSSRVPRVSQYSGDERVAPSGSTFLFLYGLLLSLGLLCFLLYHSSPSSFSFLSPPPPQSVQSLAESVAPAWVLRSQCAELFDWSWHYTGDYERYRHLMATPAFRVERSPSSPPSAAELSAAVTVNDVLSYLQQSAHRSEGLIVDFFRQLPNPEPHPLPRARDFQASCRALHLDGTDGWAMCTRRQDELNEWLPATTHALTAAFFSAYVDAGSCNELVPGTVFTAKATFHMQRWTNSPCHNAPLTALSPSHTALRHFTELIDTVGTYLSATGHFAPQQLPRLLRSLAVCPQSAMVLVAEGGIASQLLDVLVERGLVSRQRLVPFAPRTVYHADVLYRSESFPYLQQYKYNHYAHDRTDMELVHRSLVDDVDARQRSLVVVVRRASGAARALAEHSRLVDEIRASLAARPGLSHLSVVEFTASGHVRDHIALFRRAVVLVGPHGAGMLNLYWMQRGSHVVEIGYDSGMRMPEMYAEMAIHSSHQYWLVQGRGDYDGQIRIDWDDWSWSWQQLTHELEISEARQRSDSGGSSESRDRSSLPAKPRPAGLNASHSSSRHR